MADRAAFMAALKDYQKKGRRVGRNLTPGVPRRVGRRDTTQYGNMNMGPKGVERMRRPGQTPPIIQRDPLNDYQGHNLPLHNGTHPGPDPGGNSGIVPPGVHPTPRPMPDRTLGERRLGTLSDRNQANDKTGLAVLMRLFGRAQAGKNFGGKAFGERRGNNLDDFFAATNAYTQGTGYRRMLRQAAGLPVRPRVRDYPGKPRGNPQYADLHTSRNDMYNR